MGSASVPSTNASNQGGLQGRMLTPRGMSSPMQVRGHADALSKTVRCHADALSKSTRGVPDKLSQTSRPTPSSGFNPAARRSPAMTPPPPAPRAPLGNGLPCFGGGPATPMTPAAKQATPLRGQQQATPLRGQQLSATQPRIAPPSSTQ